MFASAGTLSGTGTLSFGAGASYRHLHTTTSGTIPTATWNAASTCEINGYTTNTTAPGGLGQAFGNFTWNCSESRPAPSVPEARS